MEGLLDALLQWGSHGGPHGPMGLWVLLVAVVVIVAVYLSRNRTPADGPDRAMELLREQYARGEIDDEEFDERSSRLLSR